MPGPRALSVILQQKTPGLLGEAAGPRGQAGTWDEPGAPGGKSGVLHKQGGAHPRVTGAKRKGSRWPRPERVSRRINSALPITSWSLPTARTQMDTRQPSRSRHVERGPDRIPGQGTPEAELQPTPWGGCLSDWLSEKTGGTGQGASLQGSCWRHHQNQVTQAHLP